MPLPDLFDELFVLKGAIACIAASDHLVDVVELVRQGNFLID